MTWNQELTQPEYQTSYSCIDKCLWKPIRKMLLIHLAIPFPGNFLFLFPAYTFDLNSTLRKYVFKENQEDFGEVLLGLCVQKCPCHGEHIYEISSGNFTKQTSPA